MPVRTTAANQVSRASTPTMSPARKAFWQSPYTNADAQTVKQKLKLPTLDAAKEHIGNAVLTKKEAPLEQLGVSRHLFDDQDCLTRFQRSGFTDSDVKEAKKSFGFLRGAPDSQVKGYLGLKLRNAESGYKGGMEMLQQFGITESKYDAHEQLDAFKGSGLGDRHVRAALKKFDFLAGSSTAEVKQYLGLKVMNAKDGSDFAVDFLKQIGAQRGWGG